MNNEALAIISSSTDGSSFLLVDILGGMYLEDKGASCLCATTRGISIYWQERFLVG